MFEKIKDVLGKIGPGLIVAAVVLGPGSITAISAAGSMLGNQMLWIVFLSGIFMLTFTILSARFGAINEKRFLATVAERYGRWLAALIGICAFIVSAGFQAGNNLGVGMALNEIIGGANWIWAVAFTIIALSFLFFFKSLYQALEKVMMALVVLMIVAFFSNLLVAEPDIGSIASGFIPTAIDSADIPKVAAIVATSFSVMAALFQSYLVQEKNWGPEQMKDGIRDSIVGIAALTLISMVVMITSATVLGTRGITVAGAGDMAVQLEPLLGKAAKWLFCMGLWGASFSSFLGNAVLGGTLLSDGLGIGGRVSSPWTKYFATLIMLIGMTVAVLSSRFSPVNVIIVAQATTVITVPLAAAMILWLVNRGDLMGGRRPSWWVNILGLAGFMTVLLLAINTFRSLASRI